MGVEFRTTQPAAAPPSATRWRKSRLRLRLWRLRPGARIERLLVADAAHRLAQSRRPRRAGRRLPAAQPFPRRHHPGAHAEPDDAGRHHRRGDLGFGRRRHRFAAGRSRQAARPRARATPRRRATTIRSCSRSIPSASARCCTGSSRRPTRGRASSTATARCCSTRRRSARANSARAEAADAATEDTTFCERAVVDAARRVQRRARCCSRPIAGRPTA